MKRLTSFILASLLLGACAATPQDEDDGSTVAPQPSVTEGVPRSGLPAQRLGPGECGLFLWSKTDISRFVFFAKSGSQQALFLYEDAPTSLALVQSAGDVFGQFLTDLTYVIPETGREIMISYAPGEELLGGARISSGRISYRADDGWTHVLPILGVRSCQPTVGETLSPNP
ncbi:MAG: hypothetical protein AAGJ29_04845 [Pseudomonadota bacterium]